MFKIPFRIPFNPFIHNSSLFFRNLNFTLEIKKHPLQKNILRLFTYRNQKFNTKVKEIIEIARSTNTKKIDSINNDSRKVIVKNDFKKLFSYAKLDIKYIILGLFFLFITTGVSMSLPLIIGKIIDKMKDLQQENSDENEETQRKKSNNIFIFGLSKQNFYYSMLIVFIFGSISFGLKTFYFRLTSERILARLRSKLFQKIISKDASFFNTTVSKTGDLVTRVLIDCQLISNVISKNLNDGFKSLISGFVSIFMMCFVSLKLSIMVVMIFPPLIFISKIYGKMIKNIARIIQENLGSMTKTLDEKFNGYKTIQIFSQQSLTVNKFNSQIRNLYKFSYYECVIRSCFNGITNFLGNGILICLLILGNKLVKNGDISIGDLSSFMMYAVYAGFSIFRVSVFYSEIMRSVAALDRLSEIFKNKKKTTKLINRNFDPNGKIMFDNVSFKYPHRSNLIFEKLMFEINSKEITCFIGQSGSGKSTILELLLRFYNPNTGTIYINGTDISTINLKSYRKFFGYVNQNSLLFSGTIKENILYGTTNVTEEEIEKILNICNLTEFINSLSDGIETVIGPHNNLLLSGGQKQKIALARALIRKPIFLILDEATSALDSQSEEIIMKNIKKLMENENLTIILISHRLSTLEYSNRVIFLSSKGEIIEDGLFKNLINNENSSLSIFFKSNI